MEEPYPTEGGVVPDSPRDELAKILVREHPGDYAMLIALAQDARPEVRRAVAEALTAALVISGALRDELIKMTTAGDIDSGVLSRAISVGAFNKEDALKLVPLLRNGSAKIRFAVLPVLSTKYLPAELVRTEALHLLSDPEIDIREGANKALSMLHEVLP